MKVDLVNGKIYNNLLKFVFPIIVALFLQAAYGAADLFVVGQWGTTLDISGVTIGSKIMHFVTMIITCFATGATVTIGNNIGEGKYEDANKAIGTSIVMFVSIGIACTLILELVTDPFLVLMKTPTESYAEAKIYYQICSAAFILITAYNLLGSICRGLGDSITPLITVAVSAAINVGLDILLCAKYNLGSKGVAIATVIAQGISVLITFFILKFKKGKKFTLNIKKEYLKFDRQIDNKIVKVGMPLAIQEFLVGISFLVILAIVNNMGLIYSSAIGVAGKLIDFIMLIPSAFSQAVSAFVAQNMGANKYYRARKALLYGVGTSLIFATILFYFAFFQGELLCRIFSNKLDVNEYAADYLKAYAIDTFLTSFLFNLFGYCNGMKKTIVVMITGVICAFCIRIPMAILMASLPDTRLFYIGLSTPLTTFIQDIVLVIVFIIVDKKYRLNPIYNIKEC